MKVLLQESDPKDLLIRPGPAFERLPDLSQALNEADPATKRLVFDAFDLRVVYDKTTARITISAVVTEAVADTLQKPTDLQLCSSKLWGWDSNPQPFG